MFKTLSKNIIWKNSKDIQETETLLLAEIDTLEWLQAQIVVLTLETREAVG